VRFVLRLLSLSTVRDRANRLCRCFRHCGHAPGALQHLLQIARETLEAEKQADPKEDRDKAKAALTELFKEVKTDNTPVIVERIVDEIDSIVRLVRFDGWQATNAGERRVKQALRASLLKYKLHTDQELFDKAYGYIKQYY